MPRHTPLSPHQPQELHLWQTLKTLFPYILEYRWRVVAALLCLIAAKFANVAVPLVFKDIVDNLGLNISTAMPVLFPAMLLLTYGGLRLASAVLTELRELLFVRVTLRASRHISLAAFRHLHELSLRFHVSRQTGGISRDIERGSRAISSLISYTLYSILPTLVEISLVLGIFLVQYNVVFVLITLASLVSYIVFTVKVSTYRTGVRRRVNEADSQANSCAIDSLLNYETVKYFNNEAFEAQRYDQNLLLWEDASTQSQKTLSALNLGQQLIIVCGVTAMMWQAAKGVVAGTMTVGDLVLVNAFLIQLYMPLNFLGVIYREIRQAIADIERMFDLLSTHQEIEDLPHAKEFPQVMSGLLPKAPEVRFVDVSFSYDPARPILHQVSFVIPPGQTLAVVGRSGGGKSTLARLLFRFYDATSGQILIDGQDVRTLQQRSLRQHIGTVPQDTVLFNASIGYNIQYGNTSSNQQAIEQAAKAAQLHDFIASLPDGYETKVGERGLKLSGGEKQRVAIARTLLKNPPILILDEATSALDSRTEQAIQRQLEKVAEGRTTLIITHRLSSVTHAHTILVLSSGCVLEQGSHQELLARGGHYAQLWEAQQETTRPVSDDSAEQLSVA